MEPTAVQWTSQVRQAELAERFGSPLYLIHRQGLTDSVHRWRRLTGRAEDIAWPVKANPSLTVLRILAVLGCSADCASPAEVQLALAAGIPWKRIVYNTPAPDRRWLQHIYHQGGTVVVDSLPILCELETILADGASMGSILVRINPAAIGAYEQQRDWESLVSHAGSQSKFGIAEEDLLSALQNTSLTISGLHLHMGTQMDHLGSFTGALGLLHHLSDQIHAHTRQRLHTLDLGGGLGISFQDGDSFPSIEDYVATLSPKLRSGVRYLVEPGHALIGPNIALLTTVQELKTMRGRRWAIVDVGTDQLAKVTLLHWYHRLTGPDGTRLPIEGPDAIGGPHCFAGDILLPATCLDGLEKGDTLLIEDAGAYSYALANHFNGRYGPPHVILDTAADLGTLAQAEEERFFDPTILGDQGLPSSDSPAAGSSALSHQEIKYLGSPYLRHGAQDDRYFWLDFRCTASDAYQAVARAEGSVNFVSLPFALRIAGDAAIISLLHRQGCERKSIAVWGTRLAMSAYQKLAMPVDLRVGLQLSTPHRKPNGSMECIAHWSLNEGAFAGSLLLSFSPA
jgi:diaminopimelate decarboxylase